MKEKRTYRRFDLPSFLALLACIAMLVFEAFFIFELYDRAALQEELIPVSVQPAVETNPVVTPSAG